MAYLIEIGNRTGSVRTCEEYERYVARFLAALPDPAGVTAAAVHAFAYAIGVSGKEPSASTIAVRLAAVRGFLDFARRMGLLAGNPASDVKTPRRPRSGGAAEDVSALLGHRNLSTTARYLARLEGDRDDGWIGVAHLLGV